MSFLDKVISNLPEVKGPKQRLSFKEKLKYCLYPDMFTIICPKLKPMLLVAFADRFITSLTTIFVIDLFKVAFTIGGRYECI